MEEDKNVEYEEFYRGNDKEDEGDEEDEGNEKHEGRRQTTATVKIEFYFNIDLDPIIIDRRERQASRVDCMPLYICFS